MTRPLTAIAPIAALLAAGIWGIGTAAASDGCAYESYNHNGSRMGYEQCEGAVEIVYERPRSALRRQGVGEGTTLFTGWMTNGRITGTAYRFKRGCGRIGYRVAGRWGPGGFTLVGNAPIRGSGCRVTRTKRDRLRFN